MEIGSLLAIAMTVTVLAVMIRPYRPEIAIWLSVITGLIIIWKVLPYINFLVKTLTDITAMANAGSIYFTTVLKVVGIAYLAGFGAEICRDAGEGATASKLELAGKVLILLTALPVLIAVLETVSRFLK
ncbi:MAG: stage III sporulation protein AD [Firmicutes bacterium]|nr:stage III sporulation protein AD [Bacillota bacterium]